MPVTLTIIGLGQIGTSVGLALAGQGDQIIRFGHDLKPEVAKQAQKLGAVDKVFFNLPAAVENAEIVLLALPLDQIRETIEVIAPSLQENVVVMDTAPVKKVVAEWMKELLPANRHYVGLTPSINPIYLNEMERGIQAAHADLFTKGLVAVAVPQGTVSAAIELATDLSSLLGAAPFFVDAAEVDGMMAAIHILPQLSAAALINTNMERPGWADARKLAGRIYASATAPAFFGEDDAFIETTLQNRENIVRTLDELIANLEDVRDNISNLKKEDFANWFERARSGRSNWWRERNTGDWRAETLEKMGLTKTSLWKRLFGDLGKLFGSPKVNEEKGKK